MPEGPEIRRAADRLSEVLAGRVAERVVFHWPALAEWGPRLSGRRIERIDTHGKAMLTRFAGGWTLYSHNQLYGRWQVQADHRPPDSPRSLRLELHCAAGAAFLYSATDLAVLDAAGLAGHPFLRRAGPDVLHEATTEATIAARLTEARFRRRRLGGLLTDQRWLAGLGNYLRCEILFMAGLHPRQRPADLDAAALARLARAIHALPRQSYQSGGITHDLTAARALLAAGADFETARFWVFRRAGQPCHRCATPIVREMHGGQACYLCPRCQPAAGGP